jgi:hypothetical protein
VGEAEKALYHYKHSGSYAYSDDIAQAQALQNHLSRCTEVRKLKEWNNLIKETQYAISSGADSGPQVTFLGSISYIARVFNYLPPLIIFFVIVLFSCWYFLIIIHEGLRSTSRGLIEPL